MLKLEKALANKATSPASEAASLPAELMTVKEATAYAKVSLPTIRRWIRDHGMPAFKSSNRVRIDKAELIKFLSNAVHP